MTSKLIEGYWDCAFCDTKAIQGREKICPNCGKPRGEDVIFYMKDTKNYVKDENKKHFLGESWYCSYCDALDENAWSALTVGDSFETVTKSGNTVMIINGSEISVKKQ